MFWVKALQLANKDEMNKFAMAIETMVATTDHNYIDAEYVVDLCQWSCDTTIQNLSNNGTDKNIRIF